MTGAKRKSGSVSKRADTSRMVRESTDVRALQTRAQLNGAFVALLHRRSYDTIRVNDITRKAGVGRVTFYAHFTSKDELLRSQVERVVLPMLRLRPEESFLLDCSIFFEHIRTAPHLYKGLLGGRERSGARVIRETFERHLDGILTPPSPCVDGSVPVPLAKRFVVSTLLGVASHLLSRGDEMTVDEAQCLFQKLVGSGLAAARAHR